MALKIKNKFGSRDVQSTQFDPDSMGEDVLYADGQWLNIAAALGMDLSKFTVREVPIKRGKRAGTIMYALSWDAIDAIINELKS